MAGIQLATARALDLAIAAHALAFGATLVTANRQHMARIAGLTIEPGGTGRSSL